MQRVILVRYAEIHLKGLNRPFFERLLVDRIKQALEPIRVNVEREQGRIFVYGGEEEQLKDSMERLKRVFGIHSISPACCVDKDWNTIRDAAKTTVDGLVDSLRQLAQGTGRLEKMPTEPEPVTYERISAHKEAVINKVRLKLVVVGLADGLAAVGGEEL